MTALTRLRLTDYRNYAALDLRLDTRHVCLHGPNGAGKTNLIEAVSQLGPGRGLRGATLTELTRQGAGGFWTVAASLAGQTVGVGLDRSGDTPKRVVRVDGAAAGAGDLAERIRLVWLTPAMDGVFRGGASERRRFFDRQVMAHIPGHGASAARYEKAMRERNALLERGHVDPGWADALEARMADAGAELARNRVDVLNDLQAAVDARPDGPFPKADLSLEGDLEHLARQGAGLFDLRDRLVDLLRAMRGADARAGRTLKGPHRTDLGVMHRPTGAPARDASTGQQKALLIGLILASAHALRARADGPAPLLLLDEAAAHLDGDRRAALFDEICDLGGQAWLTGTESGLFEAFGERAQRFQVEDGTVHPAR